MKPSLEIKNLSFSYPLQDKKALTDINLTIMPGDFVTICGPSGSGKSTLLRQLKSVLAPHGELSGQIYFEGKLLQDVDLRDQSSRIGYVMQNPDNQIVTDKVWHELAFGLESLGYDTPTIRARVAEMSSYFGIQTWFYKDVNALSGGQKQLLNLASIMAMQPSILILDEPTSQLDPIAASEFLTTIGKINREMGTTIIITEHRLEDVFPMSDKVIVMDEGKVIGNGPPSDVGDNLKEGKHSMFLAMPAPMRIFASVPSDLTCPITVRDGRIWLSDYAVDHPMFEVPDEQTHSHGSTVLELKDVWFKYEKDLPDVVKGLSLTVKKGEFLSILGGNGTGKSTTLSMIAGVNQPYRGRVQHSLGQGAIATLPQNPQALFVKKTVKEDLLEVLRTKKLSATETAKKLNYILRLCHLEDLQYRHPFDLSGGEQQRAALAKVLLLEPEVLLLDEPTKGLDAEFKEMFAGILESLIKRGVTIVMVSHDIEFCAKNAHRCAMFFDGNIVTQGTPRAFFSGNSFYTTSSNRMARHLLPEAVTVNDVITACGGTLPETPKPPVFEDEILNDDNNNFRNNINKDSNLELNKKKKLPLWRKMVGIMAGVVALLIVSASMKISSAVSFTNTELVKSSVGLIFALVVLGLALSQKEDTPMENIQVEKGKRKLNKRTIAAAVMILLAIPLTIFIGIYYLGDRKYYFISLLIIIETMLPFFLIFENRKPQARELIIIAVLCGIGVAGRSAFFMLPHFKPMAAIAIISAVAFGGETGFLVGAVTMLVSNVMFGQGPWTPWQMFAMGIIGFLAGVLFQKGFLLRSRLPLCIFGGISVLVIYGGLMNPASVLMYNPHPTIGAFLTAYAVGLPVDIIHAGSTVLFLWFMSRPMLEKLDRIKTKYGLVE